MVFLSLICAICVPLFSFQPVQKPHIVVHKRERKLELYSNRTKTAPPQYTKLGGLIYIHGNGAKSDWTWGCVALENDQMKELYDAVSVGTPVTIKP